MTYQETWSRNWHERILERIRQRGFHAVTDYVRAHPLLSMIDLARELGPDDVAAVQIESLLIDEARRSHTIPRAIRDLLVRELRFSLPDGWRQPLDESARAKVAGALARWESELVVEHHLDCLDEEATFEAGQDLMSADLPPGWLPEGPDDPIIVGIVDRCLGHPGS